MALDTYTALRASVADWLNRSDLTSQIPDFITLAEAKIKRRVRRKTIYAAITVATTASTTLPADLAELRTAVPATASPQQDVALRQGTLEMLADINAARVGVTGRPQGLAVVDGVMYVAPAPDQSYTVNISYYQALVPLSGSVASNVVLAEAPDIYLYGALVEASAFLDHDERIVTWQTRFDDSIAALNEVRQAQETNMSLRAARLPVVFG